MSDVRQRLTRTAAALADVLIPPDRDPGGLGAGVDHYLLTQIESGAGSDASLIKAGLLQLDDEAAARCAGRSFAELAPAEATALIAELEVGKTRTDWPPEVDASGFAQRVMVLAHEGFYADPGNGGNDGAVSWRMLGYSSRIPGRP